MSELTKEFELTKRYCLDIGRICQARCKFCYYYGTEMKSYKDLNQAKHEVYTAFQNGNDELEVTGGEPSIYPHMNEVVEFAKKIGYTKIRIITNGQAPLQKFKQLIDHGVNEILISLHGYKQTLSDLMQLKNCWENTTKLVNELKQIPEVSLYANITLMKQNITQLKDITEFVVTNGFKGINFINWNEHYCNQEQSKEEHQFQAKVSEIKPYLEEAISIATKNNLWVNVRYFPICVLTEKYRKHIVNNPIYLYDDLEWAPADAPKTLEAYQQYNVNLQYQINDNENLKCSKCGLRNVCGAVNKAYSKSIGTEELTTQTKMVNYPFHYRKELYECDIVIPMYKLNKDVSLLLNEILLKTKPPYNLHLIANYDSAAVNRNKGLKASTAPYIIMMDDDIINLPTGWNRKLIDKLKYNPEIAAVSARLMNSDGSIGANSANNNDLSKPQVEVNMIPTALSCFRNYPELKFNEKHLGGGFEDTQYFTELVKAHPGKIIIDNTIKVVHLNEEKENGGAGNTYNKEVFEEYLNNVYNTDHKSS